MREEPFDDYGNPKPGHEPPKDEKCVGCQEEIPFKWVPSRRRFEHLDLFATKEYGTFFPCPTYAEETKDES